MAQRNLDSLRANLAASVLPTDRDLAHAEIREVPFVPLRSNEELPSFDLARHINEKMDTYEVFLNNTEEIQEWINKGKSIQRRLKEMGAVRMSIGKGDPPKIILIRSGEQLQNNSHITRNRLMAVLHRFAFMRSLDVKSPLISKIDCSVLKKFHPKIETILGSGFQFQKGTFTDSFKIILKTNDDNAIKTRTKLLMLAGAIALDFAAHNNKPGTTKYKNAYEFVESERGDRDKLTFCTLKATKRQLKEWPQEIKQTLLDSVLTKIVPLTPTKLCETLNRIRSVDLKTLDVEACLLQMDLGFITRRYIQEEQTEYDADRDSGEEQEVGEAEGTMETEEAAGTQQDVQEEHTTNKDTAAIEQEENRLLEGVDLNEFVGHTETVDERSLEDIILGSDKKSVKSLESIATTKSFVPAPNIDSDVGSIDANYEDRTPKPTAGKSSQGGSWRI